MSSIWSRAQHHSLTPAVTMPLPPVLLIPPPGDDILFQTPTAARAHSGTTVHAANIELRTKHNGPNQLKTWPESSRAVVCRRTGGISPASAGCQNESATRWPAGTDTAFVARTLPLPSLPRAGRPVQMLPLPRASAASVARTLPLPRVLPPPSCLSGETHCRTQEISCRWIRQG